MVNLDKWKVPATATDGVDLELPDSKGAIFRVRLPSRHNRAWAAASERILMQVARFEGGETRFDITQAAGLSEERLDAFIDHCVVGLPDGLTHADLKGDYRPAARWLFDLASAMADDEEEEAAAAVGK